ncbi:hypothetical protein [Anderseniella sp. Alg231-50]|uniref:hypothetical protein n=1 Tax=Anderseniella sp. Alg231-50 TaxID=1922226 RepID=UPI000D5617F5
MTTTPRTRQANAALTALIVLQLTMLGALFAQSAPHPPATIPLFGIAPFLAAALSAAAAAIIIGPLESAPGKVLSVLAALMALLSYGPQKYLDAQFALIWPAVISGQIAAFAVIVLVGSAAMARSET